MSAMPRKRLLPVGLSREFIAPLFGSDYLGSVPGDHDPGVLDPLQCYNPCKHWCFPMFCPLHQTLQVATPVTNVGAASRNRTDARLRLVHVSRTKSRNIGVLGGFIRDRKSVV